MDQRNDGTSVTTAGDIYPLCDFLNDLRDALGFKTPRHYCFILGAGASLPSGIMSGRELTTNWLKELYLRSHPGVKPIEATEDKVRGWCPQLNLQDFTYENRAAFYGQIFAKRFQSDPKLGQEYLRHVITGKIPSLGYSVLAQILAHKTHRDHRIVITTNFDHLTEDALQRYAGVEPQVIGNEELAHFFGTEHQRPAIAKIHGDIFLKTYNAMEDIQKLREQWERPLRSIFKSHIPIFIGYGGNDPGFMEFLLNESDMPDGFIWTYRPKSGLPANPLIQKLAAKHHGRFVPIPGFDEFMLLLGDVFEIGKLDKVMEAENAKRVEEYRKSFDSVIVALRDNHEFTDLEHYPDTVRALVSRLAGEKTARGWWDWVVEAKKETFPAKALPIYLEACQFLPNSPQLLSAYTWFLAKNFPSDPAAESMGKSAVELAEKSLGAEHSDTLSCRNSLATLYQAKGDYDKALPLFEQTMAACERVPGAEHPDTLTTQNNLALLYLAKGDYDKALPLFEQTLAARERVLGAEHPNTLTSRNNLAMLYQAKGDYDKALPLYEQTLAARERVLGAEHPNTLTTRNNLAMLYQAKGDYDKALSLLEQTLAARERVLGAEHPDTLGSRNNLAMLYQDTGDYDKALPLFEQTLAASERVLGAEHPNTLASRNNLAMLYKTTGDYDKALPLYEQTLAARERVLGTEHPNTLGSRNNLAMLYQAKGDYDKALPLFEQTLAAHERVLGAEHPNTLASRNNLQACRKAMDPI